MASEQPLVTTAPPLLVDGLTEVDMETLAGLFKALADKRRIEILNFIRLDTKASLGAIAEWLGVGQSAASYHVKQLVDAGLIYGERSGNFIYYETNEDALDQLSVIFSWRP